MPEYTQIIATGAIGPPGPPGEVTLAANQTFTGDITFAEESAVQVLDQTNATNVALRISTEDSGLWVSPDGDNANDGLSGGSAKATIQAAHDALPAAGGCINLLGQAIPLTATVAITKPVKLKGMDWLATNLIGSGITMMSVSGASALGFSLEDIYFQFTSSHALNVGLDLGDNINACKHWSLKRVRMHGVGASGLGNNGIGIRSRFALEGLMEDVRVELFSKGVVFDGNGADQSNANTLVGCAIRQNLIGVDQVLAQDITVLGGTIEGNGTGYQKASGAAQFVGTHFENNAGLQRDLTNSAGTVKTMGCFFNFPILLTGAGNLISIGDLLDEINNSGTGYGRIIMPDPAQSYTISGNVSVLDGTQFLATGNQDFFLNMVTKLIVSHANNAVLALKSVSNAGFSQLTFEDSNSTPAGRLVYDHTNNTLGLYAGANEEMSRLSTPADGETALLVRRDVSGVETMQRVSMGAADSGGSGYKLLRVPN